MVRRSEIEDGSRGRFDLPVAVEFGTVIGGNGLEGAGEPSDKCDDPHVQLVFGAVGQFANKEVTRLALHYRHDAILFAFTHDGVDFPMAEVPSGFHGGRSRIDHSLIGEFSS